MSLTMKFWTERWNEHEFQECLYAYSFLWITRLNESDMRSFEVIKKRNKVIYTIKNSSHTMFFVERREKNNEKRGKEKVSMQICRFDRWFSERMYRMRVFAFIVCINMDLRIWNYLVLVLEWRWNGALKCFTNFIPK